ncbi:MAG: SDR family NAD(P)-dependent oxidoreductase [Chloroflexota bacterium]|jgi:short-subunit dehydrogenase
MRILLTGAFGNVGSNTLATLLERGHQVRCFDVPTKANKRVARRFKQRVEIAWGDLRDPEQVAAAVVDQDVAIHLAFVIPTLSATGVGSEEDPEWARAINVGGTQNLLAAMKSQPAPPRMLFSSSLHIYGRTHDQEPPRRVDDPPQPIEHYAWHKVECERLVRESGLTWAILRLAAALPLRLVLDPGMFDVPLDNRIEFVYSKDVGLAIANALEEERVWNQVWHIGGGPTCQLRQRQIITGVLEAVGVGMLPEKAFTSVPFPTDWLDTEESNRVLRFQEHTLDDYIADVRQLLGPRRSLIRLLRPAIRSWLLHQSPYMRQSEARHDQVALVTGASSGIGAATAQKLASAGYRVVLVARREAALQAIVDQIVARGGEAAIITADLAVESERRRVYDEVNARFGRVDVLINSAGLGWYGFGDEMPWHLAQQMLAINVTAVTQLTLLFLQDMKDRNQGHIINVSSVVGSLPSQGVALYSATKSFIDTLTSSLYRELRGSNVHVSVVKPGAVATPFFDEAAAATNGQPIPAKELAIQPDTVARRILALIKRPRRVAFVPGILGFVPWVELLFGWLIDMLGPILLRRKTRLGSV